MGRRRSGLTSITAQCCSCCSSQLFYCNIPSSAHQTQVLPFVKPGENKHPGSAACILECIIELTGITRFTPLNVCSVSVVSSTNNVTRGPRLLTLAPHPSRSRLKQTERRELALSDASQQLGARKRYYDDYHQDGCNQCVIITLIVSYLYIIAGVCSQSQDRIGDIQSPLPGTNQLYRASCECDDKVY